MRQREWVFGGVGGGASEQWTVVSGQWSVKPALAYYSDCAPGDGNSLQRAGLSAVWRAGAAVWKQPLSLGYADLEGDLYEYKQPDSLQICRKVLLQAVIKTVKAGLEVARFEQNWEASRDQGSEIRDRG